MTSTRMDEEIKRWTAKRKSALVLDIIQGKTTVAEASRAFDLSPSEIGQWVEDGKRSMENALRANPLDVKEQPRASTQRPAGGLWRGHVGATCTKKAPGLVGRGREVILAIQQGFVAEGCRIALAKLCRWFDMPRHTVYFRPIKRAPKVQACFSEPIEALIEASPSFSYRTVVHLLGMNRNTVQRAFQLKGWQVRKRAIGFRPRALPSVAQAPNERWSTDWCRIWAGRDAWATFALVIDCHTRELLGWHPSRSGKASTALSALEHALIVRFGMLGRVLQPFLLRSDNGLVFTGRGYTALVGSYGLRQEFITPHCPQQNGMVERVVRTPKVQYTHRHRFESL